MRNRPISRPQFHLLGSEECKKLHEASLEILQRTGVTINSEKARELLADAGADVSNPKRVKIPGDLVEKALHSAAKSITFYTREGEPSIFLDHARTYFGGVPDFPEILDPRTHKRRPCYAEDTASHARLIDSLPNITWHYTAGWAKGLPGDITDKIALVQVLRNSSKTVGCSINNAKSLKSMLEVCSVISGSLENLRAKPFFFCTVEPITPLVHTKDVLEKSMLAAEAGIPNVIYSMPMAGGTSPATFAGTLAVCNAEFLSHLVVIQIKKPGAPVIYGSMPNIMDMKTSIYPYGSPELNLLVTCLTELSHYYGFSMWGTAGCTDAKVIGAQAGAESMFQCLTSLLSGADFVHDAGLMDHASMISPEFMVFMNEIIDMARVYLNGIEISDQTLALDLIDSVGPGGNYLTENHTLEHFRSFWMPTIMDRSLLPKTEAGESIKHCEVLLNEKTRDILDSYVPKPLDKDVLKEINRIEESWFKEAGLDYIYPRMEE